MMAEKALLSVDDKVNELKLGRSFEENSNIAFQSMRYDFKPASVDTTQVATVEIGQKSSITLSVPHVEGSGQSHTVYKGNKRPVQKECVLIIDHSTGQFTLEKLSNTLQLKKTRMEGSSKAAQQMGRPVTPVDTAKKVKEKMSSTKAKGAQKTAPPGGRSGKKETEQKAAAHETTSSPVEMMSEDTDSSSQSDNSDNELQTQTNTALLSESYRELVAPHKATSRPGYTSMLSEDLRLSDSGSDSD